MGAVRSILTGALLVGDSVRGSLRHLVLDRLGHYDEVIVANRMFRAALNGLNTEQRLDLFPPPGLGRWTRALGLGSSQAQERTQWLLETLNTGKEPKAAGPSLSTSVTCLTFSFMQASLRSRTTRTGVRSQHLQDWDPSRQAQVLR